ncbi:MAG: transcriptional repressor LexA [Dehalococcoidia bacterium]|nr:transcriptional repressor LexA [Dehalococcoidia bacterium]
MKGLSTKQQKILDFLRRFIREKDYPPSIRDIQEACGISSTSVVDYNLKALERMGYIHRDREVSRAIELLNGSGRRPRMIAVPVVGQIAAGQPIPVPEASVDYSETVEITEEMARGKENIYALRVKGTSMIDALVNDGDIIILEQAGSPENGEMVAAWLKSEQEATLKRFYREGDRVRLQPANEAMEPIYTDADNIEIQGKVLYRMGRGF